MARGEGNGAGAVLVAFVLGAVSGAALALLYAPMKGDDAREKLGERAKEVGERAAEAAEKGRQIVRQGRETIVNAVEKGREAYQQARTKEHA